MSYFGDILHARLNHMTLPIFFIYKTGSFIWFSLGLLFSLCLVRVSQSFLMGTEERSFSWLPSPSSLQQQGSGEGQCQLASLPQLRKYRLKVVVSPRHFVLQTNVPSLDFNSHIFSIALHFIIAPSHPCPSQFLFSSQASVLLEGNQNHTTLLRSL